ncbi:MAG: hypothetical protein ACP6KW_06220, partial [Candidatus Thorarchaeota archaeon]
LDLSHLFRLQSLEIQYCKSLTSLDLSPLSSLQSLHIEGCESLTSLNCFLAPETMMTLYSGIRSHQRLPITFQFTPLHFFHDIIRLIPIVQKYEEPWKTHHLIQSTLTLLDLEWVGMLDMDHDEFAQVFQHVDDPDFREETRRLFITHWTKQLEAGGTTIGISLERASELGELAVKADRIIELRNREMKDLKLMKTGDSIDLRPLYLTAYGYQILQALGLGVSCTGGEFESVLGACKELGFTLKVEARKEEDFVHPPYMSASLAEYIVQLVKTREEN